MKKLCLQMKSIGAKSLIIGSCLAFITLNAAFTNVNAAGPADPAPRAEMNNAAGGGMSSAMSGAQLYDGYDSEELKNKHQEIDQYVFEQHNGDFSDQGFSVKHTGPSNGKIEIGITPYDDSKAEYLYDIFGGELVKVVEGIQAVTMIMPVSPMDKPVSSTSEPKSGSISNQGSTSSAEAEYVDVDVIDGDYQTNMPGDHSSNNLVMAVSSANAPITDAIAESTKPSNPLLSASILIIVVLLGGAAFIVRKLRTTRKVT